MSTISSVFTRYRQSLMSAIFSWSGGKDSCLALWRAQQAGLNVTQFLTALELDGARTRSHSLDARLITAQSNALGLHPPVFIHTSWENYETNFINALEYAKARGHTDAIFGDIDLVPHREWEEKVCAAAGLNAHLPLWLENRRALVHEFLDAGFKARVVCVNAKWLGEDYVGREFDYEFIASLPEEVDACGENGEFHTFVYDGPNFQRPVKWVSLGKQTYVGPPQYGDQRFYFDLLNISGADLDAVEHP